MKISRKFCNSKGQGTDGGLKGLDKYKADILNNFFFFNLDVKELVLKLFQFLTDFLNDSILVIHFSLREAVAIT